MSFAAHHNLKRKIGAVKKFIRKKSKRKIRVDGLEEKNEVGDAERKEAAEKEVEMSQIELSVVAVVEEEGSGSDDDDGGGDSDSGDSSGGGGNSGDALPQGWDIATDKDGDIYYYNEETGVTQWKPPRMERVAKKKKWSVNPMKNKSDKNATF